MSKWDILHVKSLEVEHGVPQQKILDDLRERKLSRDDCVRKVGDEQWWRIYEVSEFHGSEPEAPDEPPQIGDAPLRNILADVEPIQSEPSPQYRSTPAVPPLASPIGTAPEHSFSMLGEDPITAVLDESDGLPYQRKHLNEQEELDMTPMVDVAMQLILFFMVTSSLVMQMCLLFPKPAQEESNRPQVTQTIQKLDDLKTDHIMVKIKSDNTVYVDEEKQPTKDSDLAEKLESIKHARNPNGGIVIQADESAYHETVVKVVDSANLARIEPIKMANPQKQAKKTGTKKRTIK